MPQYIRLHREEIRKLSRVYGLVLSDYELLSGGASTTSIVLRTAQEHFVLTLFDDKSRDQVTRMARALCVLEDHSFPTTRLVRTKTGELITEYADHYVILKIYISGEHREDLSWLALTQIGETLANLHSITAPDFLLDSYPYGHHLYPAVYSLNLDPDYEAWLTKRYDYFVEMLPDDLPRGMIHADLFYDNVLFEKEELKAFLDFEEICNYFLVFDLATALMGLCREGTALNMGKARAFIRGYQQLRPLEASESGALQLWTDYAATGMSYWRYWKYRIQLPNPEKENSHWEMVQFADNIRAISGDQFLGLADANPA